MEGERARSTDVGAAWDGVPARVAASTRIDARVLLLPPSSTLLSPALSTTTLSLLVPCTSDAAVI